MKRAIIATIADDRAAVAAVATVPTIVTLTVAVLSVAALAVAGCSDGGGKPGAAQSGLTYHHDVRPIVEARCAGCHDDGGIAPFALLSYADAQSHAGLIQSVTAARIMPPWAPDDACTEYRGDRSLSAVEIKTIGDWVAAGAPEGDPATYQPPASMGQVGLSRVDLTLAMAEPFTPTLAPDQYRCFVLDWPAQQPTHVTGFGVKPGAPSIVHHAIAFIAPPDAAATYEQLDAADPGPGYTCFGGPGGSGTPGWMGAWVPGSVGGDLPAGSGIAVAPGSKVVLQVHYNTLVNPAIPDLSQLVIKTDEIVEREGVILPYANPSWLKGNMKIAANSDDTRYAFSFDAAPYLGTLTKGVLAANQAFTIYTASLHMHTRGSRGTVSLVRSNGSNDCLLNIPKWDFRWQGSFALAQPVTVQPGDKLSLECHWDNSAANQPVVNGQQLPSVDLNWGEGTGDEMCLGALYLTQ
jgi:hypothetical protein